MKWDTGICKWFRFTIYWLLQLASMCWGSTIIFEYHPVLGPIGILTVSAMFTGIVFIAGQSVWNSRNPDGIDTMPLMGIAFIGLIFVPILMYSSGFSSSIEDIFKERDFTIQDLIPIFPFVVLLFEIAFEMRYIINLQYTTAYEELRVPLLRIVILTVWLFFVPYWMLKLIYYSGGTNDVWIAMFRAMGAIACPIFIPLFAFGYYLSPPLYLYIFPSKEGKEKDEKEEEETLSFQQERTRFKIWKANPIKSKRSIERNFQDHKISLDEAQKYMREYNRRH